MTQVADRTAYRSDIRHAGEILTSLRDVSISYEDAKRPIVQNINLDIRQGESVLFVGPSGCGKSTLAMLCANLMPSAVEAKVTGDVWRHEDLCVPGAVGYVFQDPDAQFCMFQVADEIAFGLENAAVVREHMQSAIDDALTTVRLDVPRDAAHVYFSGGMKQKLAIASALAMKPKLLIFDEPTANLDPRATGQLFTEMARLKQTGHTMIVIEHKFDALVPYMDKIVLFDSDGQIHRTGPTEQVIDEEWAWMVQVGVLPPWKTKLTVDAFMSHALPVQLDRAPVGMGGEQTDAIHVTDASIQFGKQVIWRDVSLSVPRGSFTAIVGPNGVGKSSMLQVFAGLQKLHDGDVFLQGRSVREQKRRALWRRVSYCFQNPEHQFMYETVADEIANRHVGDQVPSELMPLLELFGLGQTALQSPYSLSQGQKRRLSVAVMLREDHDIYLLDEPTFGQDAHTQSVIMDQLLHLHQAGKTIVMTTHDMDLVARYATQVIVLADGASQYVGDPETLFAQPELMKKAYLLADHDIVESVSGELDAQKSTHEGEQETEQSGIRKSASVPVQRVSFGSTLNPPVLLLLIFAMMIVTIFEKNVTQGLALAILPILLIRFVTRRRFVHIFKRMIPFLLVAVTYIWMLSAYSEPSIHEHTISVLWMHFSQSGFWDGILVSLRLLGVALFGMLFLESTDLTDLAVGLCRNFRLQPKFSYGTLAGLRFVPLFQSEWKQLRQARQLRGKDSRNHFTRVVTYALPLLAEAIRVSERVAIAMEARGLTGMAASNPGARTYFRHVVVRKRDIVFMVVVIGLSVGLMIAFV